MIQRFMLFALLLLLPLTLVPVSAQDDGGTATPPASTGGTLEEKVNEVSARLYSPIDGARIDTCTTAECADWRAGFRLMLQGGREMDDVMIHFTGRYGACVYDPTQTDDCTYEPVSFDQVNDIASSMFCPVCENIPLDTCGTAACQDWREEVRLMLDVGMTLDEIEDDFIQRFGERVVDTPKDPLLNAISVWTPWIVVVAGLIGILAWFLRRTRAKQEHLLDRVPTSPGVLPDKDLYAQLEQDVEGR